MSGDNGHGGITLHIDGKEHFAVEVAPDKFVSEIDPATMKPTGEAKRFRLATGAPVAASLRQPTIARRKASELSSVERSALMDELVDQLIALKQDKERLVGRVAALETQTGLQQSQLDAHAGVLNRRKFWLRLRWLWSGV